MSKRHVVAWRITQTQMEEEKKKEISAVTVTTPSLRCYKDDVLVAAQYLREASHVLIVAGAGMSAYETGSFEGNVYVNPEHFEKHYPDMKARGYGTVYESMAFFDDPKWSDCEKWGFHARHMKNMFWKFPPAPSYTFLKSICYTKKDYFVWTSNVDGCFRRTGFNAKNIYTPQGEWSSYQCKRKCSNKSIWPSEPMLDSVLPQILPRTGALKDERFVPRCERCGYQTFGNVRAGGWFNHSPYQKAQERLVHWIETLLKEKTAKVAIVEIGCGYNTPTVTRYPAESLAKEFGERGRFVRINPVASDVPKHLSGAIGLKKGWGVLRDLGALVATDDAATKTAMQDVALKFTNIGHAAEAQRETGGRVRSIFERHRGPAPSSFDWRMALRGLSD
eukprot:g1920.t1